MVLGAFSFPMTRHEFVIASYWVDGATSGRSQLSSQAAAPSWQGQPGVQVKIPAEDLGLIRLYPHGVRTTLLSRDVRNESAVRLDCTISG